MSSPNEYGKGVPRRVRQAMERRGITIRRLSTVTHTPYQTLQNYLRGKHPIPAPTLARIADALEVSADWLLFARPATIDIDCLADAGEAVATGFNMAPTGDWKRPWANLVLAQYFVKYREHLGSGADTTPDVPQPYTPRETR